MDEVESGDRSINRVKLETSGYGERTPTARCESWLPTQTERARDG
jgi:hypothetical protein